MFEPVKKTILITGLLVCGQGFGQDTARKATEIVTERQFAVTPALSAKTIRTRSYLVASASVIGYGGSLVSLSNEWYSRYPQSSFHFFNDNDEWLQMDKAGHAFSAYTTGKINMEALRWAGMQKRKSMWLGALSGTAYMTIIEILDGFSTEWGFSIGDMCANLFGSGALISQELAWGEQRIQIKFSFHRVEYGDALNARADELFGRRTSQRVLKDYNGQTYWASANIRSFFKKSRVPSWLNVAFGYGADGMLGGTVNLVKDANGNIIFDRRDIPRYRQWYIAPDIDLTRIRTKSKVLKTAFFLLNSFKFPTPSIGFSNKGVQWNWVHF